MEYPALLPKPDRERKWEESRWHEKFVLQNLAGVDYRKNDYLSKQNYKGGSFPKSVDGENVQTIVKTQRNSTQLNSKATSVGVRHSSHVFHPPTPPNTNFSATSRPTRELIFGTDTH